MNSSATHPLARRLFSIEGLAAIVALIFGISYLYVAFRRITYPYDLDFIEDNMLMQAIQVSLGRLVYVPPNADFVPQVYMPLYTVLSGWIFKVVAPSYLPMRMLSFSVTIVTAILIFVISRQISQSSDLAFCAAALFLAGYRTTGGWYELARVDALFVMLTLAGAALVAHPERNSVRLVLAGVILALSFLSKQNGLFFALVITIYLLLTIEWQALYFVVPFSLVSILPILYLNRISKGWFSTYVFKIAYLSPIDFHRVVTTFQTDLFASMVGLTILFLIAKGSLLRYEGMKGFLLEPWTWCIGTALFISLAGRASIGGNRNNLMLAYTFLCIAPALAAREAHRWSERWQVPARNGVFLLIVLQFALTTFLPKYPVGFIPSSAMKIAGDRLIEQISRQPGPVLVLMHPYYAWLAGKKPSVAIQMLWHARLRGEQPLPEDFVNRIRNHFYSAVISDESSFETQPDITALIDRYYINQEPLDPSQAPETMTGVIVRPKAIYVPKQ